MTGPVLVTGCAGFIGSNLADRLARDGHDVVAYDRAGARSTCRCRRRPSSPQARYRSRAHLARLGADDPARRGLAATVAWFVGEVAAEPPKVAAAG
ncbi:NAD-dependent epimerase/dehydratase family protein [Sphingomonas sp. MMS24-JH45]